MLHLLPFVRLHQTGLGGLIAEQTEEGLRKFSLVTVLQYPAIDFVHRCNVELRTREHVEWN